MTRFFQPPTPKITNAMNGRPTLPSIHTLNLPMLPRPRNSNIKYEHHDNLQRSHNNAIRHERTFSSSSTATTVSRNTSRSPSPGDQSYEGSDLTSPIPSVAPGSKLRLRPCPLEDAEAVIVVTIPDHATADPSSPSHLPPGFSPQQNNKAGRGMLIFGPAVEKFRNPQRPLAKNARVHPYRFVRNPSPASSPSSGSRRSSVISITAHSFSNFQAV